MTVRRFATIGICVAPACLLGFTSLVAQTANLTGLVKDTQGTPVAGATVTLQCRTGERFEPALRTKSSASGTYVFSGVRSLPCRLQALAPGLLGTLELDLTHRATGRELHVEDLIIASAAKSVIPSGAASTKPPEAPTFEASGIRGLIDPGGYSVPANAAAASGMLSGMANVRRADPSSTPNSNVSCVAPSSLLSAVHKDPDGAEANRSLGDFYLTHGQPALAAGFFEAARKANPDDIGTVLHLVRAEIAQEQFAVARVTLAELPAESGGLEKHLLMAKTNEGLGLFTEAAMQYGLAEKQVESVDSVFGEGYEWVLARRLPEAHQVFERGLKSFPRSARLLVGRGTAEYLAGESAASVATFLQAVAADPTDSEAYPFLAEAYLVSGQHGDQVREAMNNYLAHAGQNGAAYYLQALVLSRKETINAQVNDADIATLLRRAIELDPSLALAHFRLAVLLARQGENEAAALQFEEALRLEPNLAEARFRLSGVDRKLGRTGAAAREMAIFRGMQGAGGAQDEEAGIDLRQFISVMQTDKPRSAAQQCH